MARRYTIIFEDVKKYFGLKDWEYVFIERVHYLCNNKKGKELGWCYASKSSLAKESDVSESTLKRAIRRLTDKKILRRNRKGFIKTTELWDDTKDEELWDNIIKESNKNNTKIGKDGGNDRVKMTHTSGQNDLGIGSKRPTSNKERNKEKNNCESKDIMVDLPYIKKELALALNRYQEYCKITRLSSSYYKAKKIIEDTIEKASSEDGINNKEFSLFYNCIKAIVYENKTMPLATKNFKELAAAKSCLTAYDTTILDLSLYYLLNSEFIKKDSPPDLVPFSWYLPTIYKHYKNNFVLVELGEDKNVDDGKF